MILWQIPPSMNEVISVFLNTLRRNHRDAILEISFGTTSCGWLFDNFEKVCFYYIGVEWHQKEAVVDSKFSKGVGTCYS